MEKTVKLFNWLAILASLATLALVVLLWMRGDEASRMYSILHNRFESNKTAAEAAKKRQETALRRNRAAKDELELELKTVRDDARDVNQSITDVTLEKEAKESETEQLRQNNQQTRLATAAKEQALEKAEMERDRFARENPVNEGELGPLRDLIEEQRLRASDLQGQLADYADETRALKFHYDSVKDALERDWENRPWIEPGERLTTRISDVNLPAGVLTIPLGLNHRVDEGMNFLVTEQGRGLCLIRVKEIGLNHSVATILPMFGRVGKIKNNQLVEITNQ